MDNLLLRVKIFSAERGLRLITCLGTNINFDICIIRIKNAINDLKIRAKIEWLVLFARLWELLKIWTRVLKHPVCYRFFT
jgi:hypothetical protein